MHVSPTAGRDDLDDAPPTLLTRHDTILGVCQGLGEDLGLNPTWLRLLFAGAFYWNPVGVSAAYLVLGLIVALARWLVPVPLDTAAAGDQEAVTPAVSNAAAAAPETQMALPLAA